MNKSFNHSTDKWIEKDRKVWVKALPQYPNPYEDAFLQGKVLQIYDKQILVQLAQSETKIKTLFSNVQKLTYGINDVADMVDLQQLNQPQLLFNIKRRYVNDLIFTYCGPTLVIINPYIYIEKLFNDALLQEYQTMVFSDALEYKSLPPHVFSLAAFCLWQLFDNGRNQSIVISGESGAGKTQNTKYCLKFLASLGKNMKELVNEPSQKSFEANKSRKINYQNMRTVQKAIKKGSKAFGIEQKILGCNEILQAFGNSKTIRNDNSSRFGKLILLLYGETQIDIKSAFIISYLLQKSRIVSVSDGERNYHIFYYFCKGTSIEEKRKYRLKDDIKKYYYLNQSTVYDLPKVSDEEKFLQLKRQFEMYLKPEEIDCIYKVLSIVLNIGNIIFKKGENKNNEQIATIVNQQYIKNVVELLQVDQKQFKHCFQYKTRKLGQSVIDSPLKFDEAMALRDSFSKNIYERVFNFLVEKLNEKIQIQKIDFESASSRDNRKSIGLLDIFGFQVLLINSLQQFFINFANQKLQQLYVSYIFKEQKNQFQKQGLEQFSHDIGFQDNQPIIDLFQAKPLGIFHLINQSSQLNKPDQNLPETIVKNHKIPFVCIPKSKRGHFQIDHSCSSVSYNTIGFTTKNKDQFPRQLLESIKKTKNSAMKHIIAREEKEEETKGKKASTKFLSSKFLSQMDKLIQQLYSCDCHFVRCIKPNSKKSPKLFNSDAVLQSLRYLGVLDSIKIRKLGYIYRRPYKQFFKKFYELQRYIYSFNNDVQGKSEEDFKEISRKYIDKYAKKELDQKFILFGSKKILINESALNHLELITKQKKRLRVQTTNRLKIMYKKAIFRNKFSDFNRRIAVLKYFMLSQVKKAREAILTKKAIKLQKAIKKYLFHMRWQKIKEVATKSVTFISAYRKMRKQRKIFLQIKKNISKMQCNVRTFLAYKSFEKEKVCKSFVTYLFNTSWQILQNKKAVIIQKCWKGYNVRKRLKELLKLMKIRAFFKRVIIKQRVLGVSSLLKLYKKPIIMLQALVRARYTRRAYLKVKKCTELIQKTYRKHLHKKFYLQKAWRKYRQNFTLTEEQKFKEIRKLGIDFKIQIKQNEVINQSISILRRSSPQELMSTYLNSQVEEPYDMKVNETISFADKNTMQIFIEDADFISTYSYKGSWTSKYIKIKNQLAKKQQFIIQLQVSQNFTVLYTNKDKIYYFHCNQQGNQEQLPKIDFKTPIQQICVSGESFYAITRQSEFYDWGDNKDYDLFSENCQKYTKVKYQSSIKAKDVSVKGFNRYYIDCQGKVYTKQQKVEPQPMNFKTSIQLVATSYNFTHFLSDNGFIYSIGSNKFGQLGVGSTKIKANTPVMNEFFSSRRQIIESISVGLAHTVVRTRLGYVYAWGDNRSNQVSVQKASMFISPTQMQNDKQKLKAIQAVAGLRASYFLTQNLQILGLGTSHGIRTTASIDKIQLLNLTNANPKTLVPLKINCAWNRQMSILTVNRLQQNKCKIGTKPDVIIKYCKIIGKQWKSKEVYPQYHEWIDNILNLGDMRKFKFQKTNNIKANMNQAGRKKTKQSEIEELKVLMDLRKTSSLFKVAARQKIQQILKRLAEKTQQQWTKEEETLSNYIKESCQPILK